MTHHWRDRHGQIPSMLPPEGESTTPSSEVANSEEEVDQQYQLWIYQGGSRQYWWVCR